MNKQELNDYYVVKNSNRDYQKDVEALTQLTKEYGFLKPNFNAETIENNINLIRYIISTYNPALLNNNEGGHTLAWNFDGVTIRFEQTKDGTYAGEIYYNKQILSDNNGKCVELPDVKKYDRT